MSKPLKLHYFVPLVLFIIPTIIISAVLFTFEPPSTLTFIGFIALVVSAAGVYYMGIKRVLETKE